MNIETLATQGREKVSNGLAGIDVNKLNKLRNKNLRDCFSHFDDDPYRLKFTARIHGIEFINDDEKNGCTDVVVSIKIEGNPMMLMMVKGKIKPALDSLVEQLKYFAENRN